MQILNTSGAPGDGAKIRIRGYSSNSGNLGPLLIVDGLKVDNIQYLDPSMIESMEVLKDAASAAIYGAEAGNGVILITTKSGAVKNGQPKVIYSFKAINQRLGKTPEIFGAQDFITYKEMQGIDMKTKLIDAGYIPKSFASTGKTDGMGYDIASYPTMKKVTFGATIGF